VVLSGTYSPIRRVCAKQLCLVAVCKHRDPFGRRRQREPHCSTNKGVYARGSRYQAQVYNGAAVSGSRSLGVFDTQKQMQPRPLQTRLGTQRMEGCTLGGSRWKIRASAV
jgi:hypothetical protein